MVAGGSHSLALGADGSVSSWGANASGQLGDGTTTARSGPATVLGVSGASAVAAGTSHSLAVVGEQAWAWGDNASGKLGDGTTADRPNPAPVAGLNGITAVAAGANHSLALRSDGTVWAWGRNANGQLGDGTTSVRPSPVQVPGLGEVVAIAAGDDHSLALRSDGSVWAWGYNRYAQVGDGSTINRISPVEVAGVGDVTAIAAGTNHSLALRSDGSVWAWGRNANGQLGDGTTTGRTSPVPVSALSGVTTIAAGDNHSLASASDGTTWAWGRNSNGQLGDGTTTNRGTPVQVNGAPGTSAVAGGANHSMALSPDGTTWAWGRNDYGQLGDGTTTGRSTMGAVDGLPGGAEATYAYDGDGLRMAKTTTSATTTAFTWDRSGSLPLLLGEETDGSTTSYIYGPGDLPLARIDSNGQVLYYHADQLGSTRGLTDTQGAVVATATYDPFGNPTASTGSVAQPFGFAGQYTDAETGLQYLRARYYDPATGQFLSRDPLNSVTREPYAYAGNNPTNFTDPTGLDWWDPRDNVLPALGEAAQDTGEFVVRNRGTIATIGAAGFCLVPAVGLAGCGYAAATAFAFRAEQRVYEQGFSNSLGANLTDGALTYLTFGLAGAFESLAGPWAGVAGVGALGRSGALSYLGRLSPAGYDITNLFGWLDEQC